MMEEEEEEEVVHFSHEHPLIYMEELEDEGVDVQCEGCKQSISGSCYGCGLCKYFLHKFCAELPNEITHPLHPQHPLNLLPQHTYSYPKIACIVCGEICYKFVYECSPCHATMHIACASKFIKIQQKIQHRTHNSRIYVGKPSHFSCDACGIEHKGTFYLCSNCGIMVSRKCAAYPKILKSRNHEHDLTLLDCLPYEDFTFAYKCEICHEDVKREYWAYHCFKCRYFVHLYCATSKIDDYRDPIDIDQSQLITLPLSDESINPIAIFMKKISEQGNYKKAGKIKHESHMHPLKFLDNQSEASLLKKAKNGKQCSACAEAVSAPFYYCSKLECEFFLHEWCTNLPKQLRLSCQHEHPLHLDTKFSVDREECKLCYYDGKTFMYKCNTCEFKIDCKCASLPAMIRHEAHRHTLFLRKRVQARCDTCTRGSWLLLEFVCEFCSFHACIWCAMLPPTVMHKYDKQHPFTLTYSPADLDANEFYCEICEREINPKLWFYHCEACDQSIHPNCLFYWQGLRLVEISKNWGHPGEFTPYYAYPVPKAELPV